nr:M13 family metallopeptidase [Maribacter sp. ACAM166]
MAIFDTKLETALINKPALEAITSVKNLKDLHTILATNPVVSFPFLSIGAGTNLNNSSMNAVYIEANGLGLPARDFYLEQDDKSIEIQSTMLQVNLLRYRNC